MTYALGRRIEGPDMWAVRRVIRDAAKRLPDVGVRAGVVDEPAVHAWAASRTSRPTAVASGSVRLKRTRIERTV